MGEANILRLLGDAEIRNGFAIGRLGVGVGRIIEVGQTVPVIATAGYCPGALFFDSNATGANNVLYQNEGTLASCDFQLITS